MHHIALLVVTGLSLEQGVMTRLDLCAVGGRYPPLPVDKSRDALSRTSCHHVILLGGLNVTELRQGETRSLLRLLIARWHRRCAHSTELVHQTAASYNTYMLMTAGCICPLHRVTLLQR